MSNYKRLVSLIVIFCFISSAAPLLRLVDSETTGQDNLKEIIQILQFASHDTAKKDNWQLQQAILQAFQASVGLKTVVQIPIQADSGVVLVCIKIPYFLAVYENIRSQAGTWMQEYIPYSSHFQSIDIAPDTPPPNVFG